MAGHKLEIRRHDDGVHQWVELPAAAVAHSGMADRVSPFSLMDIERVYLEQDVDAPLVMDALRAAGWQFQEARSEMVRGVEFHERLGRYDAHFVQHPLRDGAVVSLGDGRQAAVRFVDGSLIVRAEDGALHLIDEPGRFTEYLSGPEGSRPEAALVLEARDVIYERRYVHDVDPGLEHPIWCTVQARQLDARVGVWKSYEEPGGDTAEVFLGWSADEAEARVLVDVMADGQPDSIEAFYAGEAPADVEPAPDTEDDWTMET